jgi:hypothetical protein
MNKALTMLTAFVVGCGGIRPYDYDAYQSDCIVIGSDIRLHPNKVDLYVAKAKELFEQRYGKDTFCKEFSHVDIHVKAVNNWNCSIDGKKINVNGLTSYGNLVDLGADGRALMHELLHVYENNHFIFDDGTHYKWNEKGYTKMSKDFGFYVQSPEVNTWIGE